MNAIANLAGEKVKMLRGNKHQQLYAAEQARHYYANDEHPDDCILLSTRDALGTDEETLFD